MDTPDFSDFARDYDRMNSILSLGRHGAWRSAAVREIPRNAKRVLDLACGTGDFSLEIAARIADAEVEGLDLSGEMVSLARAKLPERLANRVRFAVGDASDLSRFPDGSFDAVTCAFGFRNFADRKRALSEVVRVLRRDGVLVVLEFFRPSGGILPAATRLWIKFAARVFAARHVAAYDYLADSIARTVSADEFAEIARGAGCSEIRRTRFFPDTSCMVFRRSPERPEIV